MINLNQTVSSTYENTIDEQIKNFLSHLVADKSRRYDARFNQYLLKVKLQAKLLSDYYNLGPKFSETDFPVDSKLKQRKDNNMFSNSENELVSSVYFGSSSISPEIIKELNITSALSNFLHESAVNDPLITATWIITKSGLARYTPNIDPAQYFTKDFDLRNPEHDPSYSVAAPKFNPDKKIRYGGLYLDAVDNGIMISAIAPVYDANNNFKAATGIDISIQDMKNEILKFQGLYSDNKSDSFAFIIDSKGMAIAFPPSKIKLLGLSDTLELLQFNLTETINNDFNRVIKNLIRDKHDNFQIHQLNLSQSSYYLAHSKMATTNWHLGILYPENELQSVSNLAKQKMFEAIEKSRNEILFLTLAMLLLVSLAINIFLRKKLLLPLSHLCKLMQKVILGDFEKPIQVKGHDEISELTRYFSLMQQSLCSQMSNLRNTEKRLKDIINNGSSVIFVKDLSGKYLLMNEHYERTFKISSKECMGKTDFEIFPANVAQKLRENDLECLQTGTIIEFEESLPLDDGIHIYMSHKFPLKDENNKVYGVCGISSDITEHKNLNKELQIHRHNLESLVEERTRELEIAKFNAEQANRAKSDFLAIMSHELRTPLNGIIGLSQILEQQKFDPKLSDIVSKLSGSSLLLKQLINDVLDLSKIESNKFELSPGPFNIINSIEEVLYILSFRFNKKSILLSKEFDKSLPKVVIGDEQRFKQIFLNIVGNALKFTDEGEISITIKPVRKLEQSILVGFIIKDTGIGISEENQQKIFNRFTQADSSVSRQFGGTGLGLSICQQLVKLMGGSITLESHLGKGSTFYYTLAFDTTTDSDTKNQPNHLSYQKTDGHVLIVDDDETNRFIAHNTLTELGFKVTLADSGERALKLIETMKFDIILMDIHMPGLNGWETTKQIRQSDKPEISSIPIIGFTADVLKHSHEKCNKAGMNNIISKPYTANELKSTILQQLNSLASKG
ncbi:MAG: response regulator [Gammaproteobacteria bacterium]|nr:response regulator [Gammaproteobacteria bacterium]